MACHTLPKIWLDFISAKTYLSSLCAISAANTSVSSFSFVFLSYFIVILFYCQSIMNQSQNHQSPWFHCQSKWREVGQVPLCPLSHCRPHHTCQYSMIIWNCQKVNYSNSALKPLPRLPKVPKVAYVWDILIFQAFGTIRFTGASHRAYLQLENIGQHWRILMKIHTLWLSSCLTSI